MISLMIFKNSYPKDFAELQFDSGIVQIAFQSKKNFLKAKRDELEEKKKIIVERMETSRNDLLEDQQEIKMAMMFQMTDRKGMLCSVRSNGVTYSFDSILKEDFDIDKIKKIESVEYWTEKYYNPESKRFDEKNKDKIEEYKKRCKNIVIKLPEIKKTYVKQIEDIDNEIRLLGSLTLKEILDKYGTEEILPSNVQENKLLVFMLRNGFIDEKYPNYMNYFHENSLTRDDMNFILSVRNHESVQFDYPLTQVKQVIKDLLPFEFTQKEILNFDLADEILENDIESEKINILFEQLSDESEQCWKFIDEYTDKAKNPGSFISRLVEAWKNMWNYLYDNQILTEERKDKYLNLICYHADMEDIIKQNTNGKLRAYFVEKQDILKRIIGIPVDKAKNIIKECNIMFCNLNIDVCNEELLNWIFDEKYFDVNLNMIQCIFESKKPEAMEDVLKRNYTAIRELGYNPLLDHIDWNISQYIEEVFLKLDTNTEESLETVLELLKKAENVEQVCKIIQKENVTLTDLDICCSGILHEEPDLIKTVWNEWIINKKLEINWKNLIRYWAKFSITEELLVYVKYGIGRLEASECPENIDPQMVEDIIKSDLEEECFLRFMNVVPNVVDQINLNLINASHMKVLILRKFFDFSKEFVDNMRQIHPDLYVLTLLTNYESVLEMLDDYSINSNELEQIIGSEMLEDAVKIQFIEQKAIKPYSTVIAMYLRNVRFKLNKEIYWNVWDVLEEDKRYNLFLNQINSLNNDDIATCFKGLGYDYQKFAERERRHNEKLYNNEYNRKLVEHLKKVSYITSYEDERKEIWDENLQEMKEESWIRCWIKKV